MHRNVLSFTCFFHSISFWNVISVWSYLRTSFIVSDFTSEPPFPSFCQFLPQNLLLSIRFYFRTSFFLSDFTSELTSFCEILPQNPHLYILKCIVRSHFLNYSLPCCCSVTQSCLTFCDSTDCSTLGFPILHYFSELAQTHVH